MTTPDKVAALVKRLRAPMWEQEPIDIRKLASKAADALESLSPSAGKSKERRIEQWYDDHDLYDLSKRKD